MREITKTGATPASSATQVYGGHNGCVLSLGTGGAEVEVKELRGSSYESITDTNDSVDTTKKLLNSTKNSRVVSPGFVGALEFSGAATVYVSRPEDKTTAQ